MPVQDTEYRVQSTGSRVQGTEYKVYRLQGTEYRVLSRVQSAEC